MPSAIVWILQVFLQYCLDLDLAIELASLDLPYSLEVFDFPCCLFQFAMVIQGTCNCPQCLLLFLLRIRPLLCGLLCLFFVTLRPLLLIPDDIHLSVLLIPVLRIMRWMSHLSFSLMKVHEHIFGSKMIHLEVVADRSPIPAIHLQNSGICHIGCTFLKH